MLACNFISTSVWELLLDMPTIQYENQDERTKHECVTLHFMGAHVAKNSRYIFNIFLMGLFHALMSEELQAAGSWKPMAYLSPLNQPIIETRDESIC